MYRFALRPRWLVVHGLAILAAVVLSQLGFWQLRRHDEKQAQLAVVLQRQSLPVATLNELIADADASAYRRVVATGTFDAPHEVLTRAAEHNGEPGHLVLTPLVLGDGRSVIVQRGWVPQRMDTPPVKDAAPPKGTVTVEGTLLPTQTKGRFGPADPTTGKLTQVWRVDLDRLGAQMPYQLLSVFVQATGASRSRTQLPVPRPVPLPDQGRHLGYAVQWFLFIPTGLAVYGALLRREARQRNRVSADG